MKFAVIILSVSAGYGASPASCMSGIRKFNELYNARLAVINNALANNGERYDCLQVRSWDIWLVGYQSKFTIDSNAVFATGSAANIYLVNNLALKYHTSSDIAGIQSLAIEYAGLKLLENTPGIPRVYDVLQANLRPPCLARLLVTAVGGREELKAFSNKVTQHKEYHLLLIGARAIEILKEVHSKGIVHGDVHWRNLMFTPTAQDVAGSLNLIDFGRAHPFLNDNGNPLRSNGRNKISLNFNEQYLSPWEIEGAILGRRDDMFRLAETLIRAGGYTAWIDRAQTEAAQRCPRKAKSCMFPEMARIKRERQFDANTPTVLIEFYRATLALEPTGTIDYNHWIQRFRIAASQSNAPASMSPNVVAQPNHENLIVPFAAASVPPVARDMGNLIVPASRASNPTPNRATGKRMMPPAAANNPRPVDVPINGVPPHKRLKTLAYYYPGALNIVPQGVY